MHSFVLLHHFLIYDDMLDVIWNIAMINAFCYTKTISFAG